MKTKFLWLLLSLVVFQFNACFSSLLIDTPVVTPRGMVPIQKLKKGDKVFTFDFNQANPKDGLIEVTIKKISRHLTDTIFLFYTSEERTIGVSPQQLFFMVKDHTREQEEMQEVDFIPAEQIIVQDAFADYRMFIDQYKRYMPITQIEKIELSATYPQYREKINGYRVERKKVNAHVYALEVDGPHTFLIGENPCYKEDGYPRLFLVHN